MNKSIVIFKWNPAISSYPMLGLLETICQQDTEGNWSVWDHERIHAGDECFLLKVGCGATGIVKAGVITSEPYADEDWSGQGRQTYYVDFKENMMVNPDALPILDSTTLEDNITDFDWHGGHSGVVLDELQTTIFRCLWKAYLRDNAPLFQERRDLIKRRRMLNDQLYLAPKIWRQLATDTVKEK